MDSTRHVLLRIGKSTVLNCNQIVKANVQKKSFSSIVMTTPMRIGISVISKVTEIYWFSKIHQKLHEYKTNNRGELWTCHIYIYAYIYVYYLFNCCYTFEHHSILIFESIAKVEQVCICIWNIHVRASLTFGILSKRLYYKI